MFWIIFFTLTAIEAAYLWFQWDKISTFVDIAKFAGENIQVHKNQKRVVRWIGKMVGKFKRMMWIPVSIILFLNMIAAGVLAIVYSIIMFIIHLF